MSRALGLIVALGLLPMAALAQTAPAPTGDPAPAPAAPTGSSEAEAGDVSEVDKDRVGPLRERIRPVSGHVFLKKGRFEFSPSTTISLRDAFFRKYIFGATFTYHPAETLGLSLRAGYSLPTVSGSAQLCTFGGADGSIRSCRSPRFEELDGTAPGQLSLLTGVDVQWAPIYGKISLLAESFAHFDMYAIGGASLVQYKADTSKFTVGGNVGVGLRFFLNRYITLRTEVRDLIYREQFQTTGASSLRNQLLFELGVSFFLPTALPAP
ncbi:MAG TPA: outer membrane beta-barrel domain-containing protein [Myxococcaceae bacterium]|nr:outer membrane beta-barrel domain-containing protein [Myxococcaceae bacterium]